MDESVEGASSTSKNINQEIKEFEFKRPIGRAPKAKKEVLLEEDYIKVRKMMFFFIKSLSYNFFSDFLSISAYCFSQTYKIALY